MFSITRVSIQNRSIKMMSKLPLIFRRSTVLPASYPAVQQAVRHLSSAAVPLKVEKRSPLMFCRQCEQTSNNVGCSRIGVCGKSPQTSNTQDALIEVIKFVSSWCVAARKAGATPQDLREASIWTLRATFSTLTNVNFDKNIIADYVREGLRIKKELLESLVQDPNTTYFYILNGDTQYLDRDLHETASLRDIEAFGKKVGVLKRKERMKNDDAFSLNEIATYGLKGVCAYASHINQMGRVDDENVMAPIHEIWAKLSSNETNVEEMLSTALRVGEVNAKALKLLDNTHAEKFGTPEPTRVKVTAVKGKAILVSGHDIADLHALLKQTEGKGVNIYTHGEMLPSHAYPELKKYKHLVGNYGTAWQAQKFEFSLFPGPIVVTSNCILEPRLSYQDRLYTINEVSVAGAKHIEDRDFSSVIQQAKGMKGFDHTVEPARFHTTGFNHRAILPLAEKIIEAVKVGDLSRIFLIGGCDGTEWNRSYFTDLANITPADSLILTLGCAKNRIIQNNSTLTDARVGNVDYIGTMKTDLDLPRVLDMGQCNDSYSAVVLAMELSKVLECDINDLPLSIALSYMEQKATAVLLTLLHLGVKNVRLGPKLPAFVTPNVLNILSKEYGLKATGDVTKDLKSMMKGN